MNPTPFIIDYFKTMGSKRKRLWPLECSSAKQGHLRLGCADATLQSNEEKRIGHTDPVIPDDVIWMCWTDGVIRLDFTREECGLDRPQEPAHVASVAQAGAPCQQELIY